MNFKCGTNDPLKRISWIFLFTAFLGLVIRIIYIGTPSNNGDGMDEMHYALIARSLMSGELPYHGVFDHKPIALYYIFAVFFQLFGYTLTVVRMMPFASIVLASWLLYQIAKKQFPPHQHFVALSVILLMTICGSLGTRGVTSNTEILQMPIFAGWWLVALSRPDSRWLRPLLLGALTGLATQINYLGGFVLALSTALMLAWPLFVNASRKALATFATGSTLAFCAFIAVVMILLAPLIVASDLSQYLELQSAYLASYRSVRNLDQITLLRAAFALSVSVGLFVALLACMGWDDRSLRGVTPEKVKLLSQLAAVYAITLIVIALPPSLFPQYFNLLIVPATLILLTLLVSAGPRALRRFAIPAVILITVLLAKGASDAYLKDWYGNFRRPHEIARLTGEIRSHAKPGERVLLLDLPLSYYFLADVKPATRFVLHIFWDGFLSKIGSSPSQEIIKALASKPVFVMACFDLVASKYRPLVEKELAEDYRGYALPGYEECHDLKAYYLLKRGGA